MPRLEPLANAPGLGPAFIVQVALGAAVAQAETRGIEGAGGQRVAKQRHHSALAQQDFGTRFLGRPGLQGCEGQTATY